MPTGEKSLTANIFDKCLRLARAKKSAPEGHQKFCAANFAQKCRGIFGPIGTTYCSGVLITPIRLDYIGFDLLPIAHSRRLSIKFTCNITIYLLNTILKYGFSHPKQYEKGEATTSWIEVIDCPKRKIKCGSSRSG